jgi:hypothetical protein
MPRFTEIVFAGKVDRERVYDLGSGRDCARYVARHAYAWPGGYPLIVVTADGAALCARCVRDNFRLILESWRDFGESRNGGDGWTPAGMDTAEGYADEDCCDNCGASLTGAED